MFRKGFSQLSDTKVSVGYFLLSTIKSNQTLSVN